MEAPDVPSPTKMMTSEDGEPSSNVEETESGEEEKQPGNNNSTSAGERRERFRRRVRSQADINGVDSKERLEAASKSFDRMKYEKSS